MKPIVTVTLNPCIDASSEAEVVYPTRKIRTTNERYDPGGGGINVARVVDELGGRSLATYLAGGATGSVLDELMKDRRIPFHRINIAGHTRMSQVIFERSTGLEYRFVPEGPVINSSELQQCLKFLETVDTHYLVVSGSLPRGAPEDIYVRIQNIARLKNAKFVVDTSGAALHHTLGAGGIYLMKPSLGELEQLVGRKLSERNELEASAMSFVNSGKTEFMAVTLGHRGAFLAGKNGITWMDGLRVDARSAVGAGDSFVGGMTFGLAKGMPPTIAFLLGMSAGTAAVLTPGTELCKRSDVERYFEQFRSRLVS